VRPCSCFVSRALLTRVVCFSPDVPRLGRRHSHA
jgi:hypothetical protein